MKLGDKLLCKKKYKLSSDFIYFDENKFFYIQDIEKEPTTELLAKKHEIFNYQRISIFTRNHDIESLLNFSLTKNNYLHFNFTNPDRQYYYTMPYIWDYFYTPSEIRKMKINKINNIT